jgi:hypothetical protein
MALETLRSLDEETIPQDLDQLERSMSDAIDQEEKSAFAVQASTRSEAIAATQEARRAPAMALASRFRTKAPVINAPTSPLNIMVANNNRPSLFLGAKPTVTASQSLFMTGIDYMKQLNRSNAPKPNKKNTGLDLVEAANVVRASTISPIRGAKLSMALGGGTGTVDALKLQLGQIRHAKDNQFESYARLMKGLEQGFEDAEQFANRHKDVAKLTRKAPAFS